MFKNHMDELIKIRRQLHSFPELGFQEYKTSSFIYEYLKDIGISKIEKNIAGTGIVALIDGGNNKKTIALRADMDALPISEETGVSYVSQNKGVMHACGHDGHVAILLVAAKILYENRNALPVNVKLIFQPAEEMLGGGKEMVKSGVLDNPDVAAIIGLHLWMDFAVGEIGVKSGPVMAAMDKIDIKIKGRESHGAMPHKGVDAIVCASELVLALQTIISREIDPLEPAVITIGEMSGGTAYNVIANEVKIKGTVRSFNEKIRELILSKIERKTYKIAGSYNADVEINLDHLYPVTQNSNNIVELIKNNIEEYKIVNFNKPFMSSEDFSYYLQEIPGALLFIGAKGEEHGYPLHHSKFNFDEEALLVGLNALVNTTYSFS